MNLLKINLLVLILVSYSSSTVLAEYQIGIDVSHWQGTINWRQVSGSGIKFAFIKATEGVGYADPKFTYNITNADAEGLKAGPYHFATPYTNGVNDAVDEADYFVSVAGNYMNDGYLRPVLDLERGAELGKSVLSQWIHSFMNRVKQTSGIEPLIYCNRNYADNYFESSVGEYDMWFARWTYDYTISPIDMGIFDDWAFWQYSNHTTVPGISGNVDGDVCKDNLVDFVISEPNEIMMVLCASVCILICQPMLRKHKHSTKNRRTA